MTALPLVDVNLFVRNGAATIASAIESVLAQTWPELTLTVIDNCSTDATPEILSRYATDRRIRLRRNRADVGPVANCQRAFWEGDAAFVLPKTADDLLAPEFIERVMAVMLAQPDCVMCHADGLVFDETGAVAMSYPESHRLLATDDDPVERACHVMGRYTSAPSFWGIYRRDAVDRLARINYRAGWDHSVLAELALYGAIHHVPELLFWRRDGGKPVATLARGCTEAAQRGLGVDDALAEHRWRTPLITTAYAHIAMFSIARLDIDSRRVLMKRTPCIFRDRWGPLLRREAVEFRAALPRLIGAMGCERGAVAVWMAQQLTDSVRAVETILPELDFTVEQVEIATLASVFGRVKAA